MNIRAEVIALWGLLWFASMLCIEDLWVYGDSKVLIDHLNKETIFFPGHLTSWMERIKMVMRSFNGLKLQHIYKKKNSQADKLSKIGLQGIFGTMNYDMMDIDEHGALGSVDFI